MLTDFCLHIDRTIFIMNVAEIVANDKDFWHFNLGTHATTCNIFLENYAIDILAFLLVWMLDCNNFDERVEVDGVGKHS